jgi:hypothetical protein
MGRVAGVLAALLVAAFLTPPAGADIMACGCKRLRQMPSSALTWLGVTPDLNFVHWFDGKDPAPRVIEERGRPVSLELRGRTGKTLSIPFQSDEP